MFQLIYASTATHSLGGDALESLVDRAREKNARLSITGVLIFRNGSFLHVLEGEEGDVRSLYDTIQEDDRHRWVTLLKAAPVEKRDFPGAPMVFRNRSVAGARRTEERASLGAGGSTHEALLHFEEAGGRGRASVPGRAARETSGRDSVLSRDADTPKNAPSPAEDAPDSPAS